MTHFLVTRFRQRQTPLILGSCALIALAVGSHLGPRLIPSFKGDFSYDYSFAAPAPTEVTRQLEQEIAFYKRRIQQTPGDGLHQAALATAYLRLARATGSDNWYLLAEQAAQQSLDNLPFNNGGALLAQAQVAGARHDFDRAIDLAQQVLAINSQQEDALAILVTAYLAQGELAQAEATVQQLLALVPTQNAHTLRALVHIAQGEDEQAIASFEQALIVEEPNEAGSSVRTRTLMGRFYASRGETQLATQLYQQALEILPRSPQTLTYLAQLETRQGHYRRAEKRYQQVFISQDYPNVWDHVALQGLADVKRLRGDLNAAHDLWGQAETLFRHHEDLSTFGHRRELARLLLARGDEADLTEALALMEADLAIRQDVETLDTYAWVLTRLGRWQAAQRTLQTALATGVRHARLTYRAAQVAEQLGEVEQAALYRQQAEAIDPTFDQQDHLLWGLSSTPNPQP